MANRYFLNIGANYNSTANWSATSGGAGGASVPTNADDVFFDVNSGNCTVNVASVAKSVNFTGYTNTITMTSTLTVSGSVTLVAAMTIAGASGLTINATGTFTSNGKTWPNALTLNTTVSAITITLADDLNVNGLLLCSNSNVTVNGTFNINCSGGLNMNSAFVQGTGVTTLNLLGGTWSGNGALPLNTNINGNITISGTVNYQTKTLTHISGTVITTGSTLLLAASPTLNTSGISWNNITTQGSSMSITLLSDLNILGLFTGNSTLTTVNGTFNINVSGGITFPNAGIVQGTGTTTLYLLGGTWSSAQALRINTVINGNLTISGTVAYNTGTLTYTSGTVTTTGSTLNIGASTTLNTSGMSWNNVTMTSGTLTLTSDLYIRDTLTIITTSSNTINGNIIYLSGSLSTISGNQPVLGTTLIYINGSGTWLNTSSSSTRLNITIDTNGTIYLSGTIRYQNNTINYIKGKIIPLADNILLLATSTLLNFDKINLRTITILSGQTITMNKFFSGSALIRTTIQSGTAGSNYTIVFQDGFEKITKFTKISNCTVTNRGQLLCITDKSNKGGNVGVRYINQMPNRVPLNSPSTVSPLGYAVGQVADPNTILI